MMSCWSMLLTMEEASKRKMTRAERIIVKTSFCWSSSLFADFLSRTCGLVSSLVEMVALGGS